MLKLLIPWKSVSRFELCYGHVFIYIYRPFILFFSDCGEACVFERYDVRVDRWRTLRKKYVKSLPEPPSQSAPLSDTNTILPPVLQNSLVGKDVIALIDEKLRQEKTQEIKDDNSNDDDDEYESDTC